MCVLLSNCPPSASFLPPSLSHPHTHTHTKNKKKQIHALDHHHPLPRFRPPGPHLGPIRPHHLRPPLRRHHLLLHALCRSLYPLCCCAVAGGDGGSAGVFQCDVCGVCAHRSVLLVVRTHAHTHSLCTIGIYLYLCVSVALCRLSHLTHTPTHLHTHMHTLIYIQVCPMEHWHLRGDW